MAATNENLNQSHRRTFVKGVAASVASAALAQTVPVLAMGAEPTRPVSQKKGLAITTKKDNSWQKKIQAIDAKWFYSWGAGKPSDVPKGIEFVPMIWGKLGKKGQARLDLIKAQGEQGEFKQLLGFNEPDKRDQSNMTVEQAVAEWPKLMEAGLPLVSPGCAHPDRKWMIDFMKAAEKKKLRVDYIAVHSYGGPNAKHLLARLKKVYQMFGRPLWITEFAVGDWTAKTVQQNKHSPKKVAKFMREVLPMLEAAPFVYRYAWFPAGPKNRALGTSALFDDQGNLTTLGKIYRSM